MMTYEVTIYEQEDFDKVKREMTDEQAADILERLSRGWFPYTLPEWGNASERDLDNYKMCLAIYRAIDKLRGVEK